MKSLDPYTLLSVWISHLPEACFAIDTNGRIIAWNKLLEELTRIPSEMVLEKGEYEYSKIFYNERRPSLIDSFFLDRSEISKYYPYVSLKEKIISIEEYNQKYQRYFLIKANPIYNEQHVLIGAMEIIQDVTDRVKAEEMLAEDEHKFKLLFHLSNDCIFIADPLKEFSILESNQKGIDTFGFSDEEIRRKKLSDLVKTEAHKINPDNRFFETVFKRKDDTEFDGEISINSIHLGETYIAQIVIRDISERKRMEKLITAEKEMLAVTLKGMGEGVLTINSDGIIDLFNEAAEKITGWSKYDAIGKKYSDVYVIQEETTNQSLDFLIENLLQHKITSQDYKLIILLTKEAKWIQIHQNISPIFNQESQIIGIVVVFQDVTEHRKFEEELFKTQKIESIGVLAGGIAHDFNNILTSILGNLSIAKLELNSQTHPINQILTDAEKATIRATNLTKQLLTFSKGGEVVKKTFSLSEMLRETAIFALRGSKAALKFQIAPDLWDINADEGQISQVINNIVINADQAMPEGGTITIAAENNKPPISIAQYLLKHNQNYIHISIMDEGIGIPRDIQAKVFDPYFTTKSQGTGLGLSVCYSIVKNHEGFITFETNVGKGTTFHIFLPSTSDTLSKSLTTQTLDEISRFDGKSALIMDDEILIREVLGKMLKKLGFSVQFAKDGTQMIEMYREALKMGTKFDLVISDLTIPGGMGGKEAIKEITILDPDVVAVVSSGYSTDKIISNYKEYGFKNVLIKPYKFSNVQTIIRSLIVTNYL